MTNDLMMKLAKKLRIPKNKSDCPSILTFTPGNIRLRLAALTSISWSLEPNPDLPALANWIMKELSKTAHLATLIWYGDNKKRWDYIFHVEDGVFEGRGNTPTAAIVEAVKKWVEET